MQHTTHNSQWLSGCVALCIAAGTATGADRDYAEGFAKFHKLGLPNLARATYVHLELYGRSPDAFDEIRDAKLAGNAWLIEENKKGKSRFAASSGRMIEVYDRHFLEDRLREQQKNQTAAEAARRMHAFWERETSGEWKTVDLVKDVERVLGYLAGLESNTSKRRSFLRSDKPGRLFLTAAHFHAKGHTEEANRIVAALFRLADDDPRDVLVQALDQTADALYERVYDAFRADRDWEGFALELDKLLEKFPDVWRLAPAVERLSRNVKERARHPDPPALAGPGLTEEDHALARALVALTEAGAGAEQRSYYEGGLWLLFAPTRKPAPGVEQDAPDLLTRIKARGLKSMPLLLALAEDSYLIGVDLQELTGRYHSRHYYHSSGSLSEERITRLYDEMRRPASRSDVARRLLRPVLFQGERRSSRDDDTFVQDCRTWFEQHGSKSPAELAHLYLAHGDHNQRRGGVRYLIRYGDEKDMQAIATFLLATDEPDDHTDLVREYVRFRRDKARAFVAAYDARLRKYMADDPKGRYAKRPSRKENMEKLLTSLKETVEAKSAQSILDELLAGKTSWNETREPLSNALGYEPYATALNMVLGAAERTENAQLRQDLIYMVPSLRYLRARHGGGDWDPSESEQAAPDIAEHAALWRMLLNDTRVVKGRRGNDLTVAAAAAWTIESLYGEEGVRGSYRLYQLFPEKTLELVQLRAEGRLAGKPAKDLPKYPSADDVPAATRATFITALRTRPESELSAYVDGLGMAEQLALIDAADDHTDLAPRLVGTAHRVVAVNGTCGAQELVQACKTMAGQTLAPDTIEGLMNRCTQLQVGDRIVRCTLSRLPCLRGVEVELEEYGPDHPQFARWLRYGRRREDPSRPLLHASLGASKLHASAEWLIGKANSATVETGADPKTQQMRRDAEALLNEAIEELAESDARRQTEEQKEFHEKLALFCKGTGNVCRSASIRLVVVPAGGGEGDSE